MPEWLMGTDCKSVSIAYVGSNPTRPIIIYFIRILSIYNINYIEQQLKNVLSLKKIMLSFFLIEI